MSTEESDSSSLSNKQHLLHDAPTRTRSGLGSLRLPTAPTFGSRTSLGLNQIRVNGSSLLLNKDGKSKSFCNSSSCQFGITPGGEINQDQCYSWLHTLHGGRIKKESESSDDSSSGISLPMPTPPDGGWGWFVVLGAFFICVICDGLAYCFGLLYHELLEQFDTTRSMASLVGSIFFGASMILGPLASSLTTRFGCRKMTIFGGLLSSLGLFLSSFANSISMLCFTFGIIVGSGFSFCYVTSVVIVAFYFEKRRALATGLAVCGTGIGTFTFAPLIDFIIHEYGWRGLFLIMSGISLNLVVCGMLFRPLKFTEVERWNLMLQEFNRIQQGREAIEVVRSRYPSEDYDSDSSIESTDEDEKAVSALNLPTFVASSKVDVSNDFLHEAIRNSRHPHRTMQRYLKNTMMRVDLASELKLNVKEPLKEQNFPRYIAQHPSTTETETISSAIEPEESTYDSLPSSLLDDSNHLKPIMSPPNYGSAGKLSMSQLSFNTKSCFVDSFGNTFSIPSNSIKKKQTRSKSDLADFGSRLTLTEKIHSRDSRLSERRMSGMHMGRHNALGMHLPLYRSDIFYRRLQRQNNPLKQCTLGTSCPEFTDVIKEKPNRWCVLDKASYLAEEIGDVLKTMVDLELLRNPFFCIFLISNVFLCLWCDVPYIYAVDHAIEMGIDQQKASFLLSIIGILNTIGQVVFGYVGDLDCNLLNVYAIVSVLAGASVAVVPLMPNYWSMCIMYALFGFFISVSVPLTTVLLVKYLGMEKLTSAYGFLMLMQGIGNMSGPPFAGWVSDETGNYNCALYISGIFYAVSGVMMYMVYIPRLVTQPFESEAPIQPITITVEPQKV